MNRKLYIKTHGCQMNTYDSDRIADLLYVAHNLECTKDPYQADLLLLNTCSIREKAQEKVFSQLGLWKELKASRPNIVIGVGGCVASQEGDMLIKRAPYIDLVFGPQTLHRLPNMLMAVWATHQPVVDISFPEIEKFDQLPEPSVSGPTAFVSIMEGCSKYCTFCVVPYTRGEEVSRPFETVIAEVQALSSRGVREITLLGQNVNAYRGIMKDGDIADLALLIEYIATVPGIDRIRYTTSHPVEFSERLIEVYRRVSKLVNHLHLPVQSGSDRILAVMKRGYTSTKYKDIVGRLRTIRPELSLSSDFIVGFPGETEKDFMATMALIDDVNFDHGFSFIYSPRPGTPAATLADNTPLKVKKERLALLQASIEEHNQALNRSMVGTLQRVLVDKIARKDNGQISGRTENNRVINFDGEPSLIGHFVDVLITEAMPNSLRGLLHTRTITQPHPS